MDAIVYEAYIYIYILLKNGICLMKTALNTNANNAMKTVQMNCNGLERIITHLYTHLIPYRCIMSYRIKRKTECELLVTF